MRLCGRVFESGRTPCRRGCKEPLIEFEGAVIGALPDGRFRVRLDNGHEVLAYTSGRMKKAHIRCSRETALRSR